MALSKRMVQVLMEPSLPALGTWYFYRDARTLRALQNRGHIKALSWQQRLGVWRYKYTKTGARVARQLNYIDSIILQEIVR